MAEENRPASPPQAPDPADSYERAHPENEAGMGRMDREQPRPSNRPDRQGDAAKNRQDPTRQINGENVDNQRSAAPDQPDHSMHDEEPDGWDQAPTDIHDPKQKRHPRTEGKGGTP